MLNLRNFESALDPDILDRGEQYYERGAVERLVEERRGAYVARVRGTDLYAVRVTLDEDDVVEYMCSCPYDKGPVCKHVAAVFYALADGEREIEGEENNEGEEANEPPRGWRGAGAHRDPKRPRAPADHLEDLSKEELAAIVREARAAHADVDRRVAMTRAGDTEYEDKRYVRQIVRGSIEEASDRYGGIDYGDTLDAVQGALEVLDVAERLAGEYPRTAAVIYETVIEELAPCIERADDSDGDIGGTLESAFASLDELAVRIRDDGPEEVRTELFAYVLKEWPKKKYRGWDWSWMFLAIAADLVVSPKEEMAFDQALIAAVDYDAEDRSSSRSGIVFAGDGKGSMNAWGDRYRRQQIAGIRLKVIERLHPETVEAFLDAHIALFNIRKHAIERSLAAGDTGRARALAEEGAAQAERDGAPGLVIQFLDYLLQCAVREQKFDEAAERASRLFLEARRDEFDYYRKAKEYAEDNWPNDLAEIITALKSDRGSGFGDRHKLAEVYVEEEMWGDLLALAEKHPEYAQTYGVRLAKRFPKETGLLYIALAKKDMEYPGGRGVYQQKCKLLQDAKRLGCEAEVARLAADWRTRYGRRRALMEELRRVC